MPLLLVTSALAEGRGPCQCQFRHKLTLQLRSNAQPDELET